MSRLWRTNEGGKWKIEQYSGRPETAIKHFVSLLRCFWGGIKDYDDDCADIEIRQFCGCQPASIWLNGFYITTSSSSSFHPPPTHIPTFCRRMAKFNITLARIDYSLDLWKWTVTYHPPSSEPLKGWGQSVKLGPHSAIWGKLGTALQAYTLYPCTKFPPNPTSRKVKT